MQVQNPSEFHGLGAGYRIELGVALYGTLRSSVSESADEQAPSHRSLRGSVSDSASVPRQVVVALHQILDEAALNSALSMSADKGLGQVADPSSSIGRGRIELYAPPQTGNGTLLCRKSSLAYWTLRNHPDALPCEVSQATIAL